jgi:hypothetical protein
MCSYNQDFSRAPRRSPAPRRCRVSFRTSGAHLRRCKKSSNSSRFLQHRRIPWTRLGLRADHQDPSRSAPTPRRRWEPAKQSSERPTPNRSDASRNFREFSGPAANFRGAGKVTLCNILRNVGAAHNPLRSHGFWPSPRFQRANRCQNRSKRAPFDPRSPAARSTPGAPFFRVFLNFRATIRRTP